MLNTKLKFLIIFCGAISLMGCEEQLTSGAGTLSPTPKVDEINTPEQSPEEESSIEILSNFSDDAESADEVLSDDETNVDPSEDNEDSLFSDSPFDDDSGDDSNNDDSSDNSDNSNDDSSDDNGDSNSNDDSSNDDSSNNDNEDPADDEAEEDEANDEACRKRGNLLHNGSFEIVDDRLGLRGKKLSSIVEKNWDVFQSLPSRKEGKDSWYTSDGAGIEIQGHKTVAPAAHGKRVVELDSHGGKHTNSTMSQDVLLCRGKHILKFMYYPRTKKQGDNTIEVRIGDKVIKSVDMVKDGKWYRVRAPFRVKKMKRYTISLAAKGIENSLGGLVDKVSLHKRKRRAGVVTSLLSLGDMDNIDSPLIRREIASAAIRKFVNFASLKKKPKILFVKDSRHGNESLDDFVLTEEILRELFGSNNVSVWSQDLRMQNAEGYDVVYIINPGYPMGSSITANTLKELKSKGNVGIVIHGDDMARGRNFNLKELTGLKYKSNGTRACGIRIDNNRGNKYAVKLRKRFFKKLSSEERTLDYANDIDHTEVVNKKVRILAMAKAPRGCSVRVPAIVGYKLQRPKKKSSSK